MSESSVFRINQPQVIHRTIDGEVVIINLASGTYYSLLGSGARIWSLLEQRLPMAAILRALEREYYDPALAPVSCFIEELQAEALIVSQPANTADVNIPDDELRPVRPPAESVPFEKPVLQRFDDMQELLLLDPIHEVDEAGWPHTQPNTAP